VAALAQLTAATTGILTTDAKDGPFGFCHFAARPGDLVAWTPSLSASPEGIGPVWQLTAVETATRYGIGTLVAGDKSARDAASFVDHLADHLHPRSGSPRGGRMRRRRDEPLPRS
jgi:hypothetical protein